MKDDDLTIDLTSIISNDTITIGSATSSPFYVSGDSMATPLWSTTTDTITIPNTFPRNTLTLTGDDADIDINGVSLMETLREIQDRLNIMTLDPAMEQEWDELRLLREQYEAKLAECREKSRAWRKLQQDG